MNNTRKTTAAFLAGVLAATLFHAPAQPVVRLVDVDRVVHRLENAANANRYYALHLAETVQAKREFELRAETFDTAALSVVQLYGSVVLPNEFD